MYMEHTENIHHKVNKLEMWMADIFKQAPHIPEGGRKVLVDIAPYVALILGVLGVLGLLFGAGASILLLVVTLGTSLGVTLNILISLVAAVLFLLAYKGLAARSKSGWNFLFWSELVSLAGVLIGIVTMYGMNIAGLVGSAIGFYILFEIRSHYK